MSKPHKFTQLLNHFTANNCDFMFVVRMRYYFVLIGQMKPERNTVQIIVDHTVVVNDYFLSIEL